jgi:predicted molibdopterin-dependent oxidoreductase YjgC
MTPLSSSPELAKEAFSRLEFVVVVDSVKTEAMKYAHVVLPGALLAEKKGHSQIARANPALRTCCPTFSGADGKADSGTNFGFVG